MSPLPGDPGQPHVQKKSGCKLEIGRASGYCLGAWLESGGDIMKKIAEIIAVMSVLALATACGGGGSSSNPATPVPPPAMTDTTAPTVMFDPATGSVLTGQTFAATLTATDDVGVTSGPDVNCSNGGSFANNLFTAPDVTTETTSVCTATASDAAGNEGSATLTMTVTPPPDTTDPVVMFDPASGSVLTGQTFAATLTATDDVGVTSGPDVSCSNGGSFANNLFTAPDVTTETTSVCTATAGDAAGNEGSATLTVTVTLPASVIISGQLTFDFVPHADTGGLDYSAITQNPMRGVVVQALNASGAVLDSDISDASGNYAVNVSPGTDVRIRARAQLLSTSGATWDVMVTDNTTSNAFYVFDGSLADSGTTDSTRNLNAGSGWDGSAYTSERAAAPFAILDPVYDTIQKFAAVDPDIVLPPFEVRWSVNNRAVEGNREDGEITTSTYLTSGTDACGGFIYLLGDADADTDEYDPGVIVRLWGYYFENCFTRSDSIGGLRAPGERLDPRLAMSDGWVTAVAAIGTGDPVVRNSFGPGQGQGSVVDVEANTNVNAGWYNAASVSSILYDVYDSTDDGADVLSLGLGPIYRALVDPGYTGTPVFTTIFTFLDQLKAEVPGSVAAIDALAAGQDIDGTGADGAGETNDGGIASALPVYHTAVIDGAAVEVCSVDDAGFFNKLGNRAFVRLSVPTEDSYTITMSGPRGNPGFAIYSAGIRIEIAASGTPLSETWTGVLPVGEYVIEALDFNNTIDNARVLPADYCHDITITPVDTTDPVVMFSPASGSVLSTQTLASTLTATDNVGVTSGPDVSCSNGGSFANNLFTAPDVMTETTSVCTATASDAAGNEGSATLTVTVTLPDPTVPIVRFRPASGTVPSGQTFAATLTATDDVGVTSGPDVSCSNGGSFANNLFTAPVVTTLTTSVCTATAGDADGNEGSATLTMTVTPPDTTDPVVMFTPATGSVLSGQTFAATLTATDDVGVTSGPTVSCSNGGSFANNLFTAPDVTAETTSVCTATAGDAAGNEGSATLTMTIAVGVIISGQLTFDFVPHDTTTGGLDYSATRPKPMRGIVVEALDGLRTVLDTDISDASGNYAVNVSPGTDVRIRARFQLLSTSGATWDVRVTDNTNNNGLYAFGGSLADSGTTASTRDLHLSSGWDGSAYTGERAGGIAAILDPVYDTMQKFAAVDPDIAFPPLEFRWSVNNRAVEGSPSLGEITTSSYFPAPDDNDNCGYIYLLGDENADTDEYDPDVVVHEWGHYFEDCLSRADSPGGPHALGDRLDSRLALAEGWGDAVAAIGTGNPVYYDSVGPGQGAGSVVDVEANTHVNAGWYNAASVSSILYDVYDSADDGADVLSLGLGPIYRTLVDPGYTGTPLFTTIFTFLDRLKAVAPGNTAAIEALAAGQDINGTGADGAGETNDGGIASALPVYHTAVLDGAAVEVCSVDDAGFLDKLGNRAWVRFSVPAEGTYTITMVLTSGPADRADATFAIFRSSIPIDFVDDSFDGSETWTGVLPAGEYVIEAIDFANADVGGADFCYDITLTTG